jgi:chaperonin GroEL
MHDKNEADNRGNFLIGNNFKSKASIALTKIADSVACTLGPLGSNVFLEDQFLQHVVTKDGYTVISKMAFADPVKKSVLNYVQKVSSRLNQSIGDGTTTAVVIATELFKQFEELKEKSGISDRVLSNSITRVVNQVVEQLKTKVINIPSEIDNPELAWNILTDVASVSANNDREVGERIITAMKKIGRTGTLAVKPSFNSETSVTYTSGIEVERGMILPILMNNQDDRSFEAAGNVFILMSEEPLGGQHLRDISVLMENVCMVKKGALVIIAPNYDEHFLTFIMTNKMNPELKDRLPILAIDIATRSSDAKARFDDLSTYVSALPWSHGMVSYSTFDAYIRECCSTSGLLGKVHEVKATEKRTVFIGSPSNSSAPKRAKALQDKLVELEVNDCESRDNNEEKSALRHRIRSLNGSGIATIMVGGDSQQEKKSKVYLVEDAICAAQSALKHGILPGCCLSTISILMDMLINTKGSAPSIDEILTDFEDSSTYRFADPEKQISIKKDMYRQFINRSTSKNDIDLLVCGAFTKAYMSFFARIFHNSVESNIVTSAVCNFKDRNMVTDIANDTCELFSIDNLDNSKRTKLLTSGETDIEVIKSASSIATLITTSEVFVSWNTIFND